MADEYNANSSEVEVKVSSKVVEEDQLHGFVVVQDQNQPDMCIVTTNNEGHTFSNSAAHGDAVEVKVGDTTLFKGEVVGVEPIYKVGGESKCIIRAYNRMHRLLRGRKSRTFLNATDTSIAETIAGDAGLSAQCGSPSPSVTHDHVYQHNQTNLEFLRIRAARVGFEVLVDDKTLIFDKRKTDQESGIELSLEEGQSDTSIVYFAPRMSSASMVNKVECHGWDPDKKEAIVGTAEAKSSKLGKKAGYKAASAFGSTETFEVDHPIFSADEAKGIAQSRLDELLMTYITGEAAVKGNPGLKPGIVVKMTVNVEKDDDKFNGKYFVAGATHQYSHDKGGGTGGGYRTTIRVKRDAEGGG